MQLKILVLPFFLVMTLVLSIWYVKPTFDEILATKADISAQNALIKDTDSVLNNISALNASLDRGSESEQFLLHYLPYTMNQDQTIDAFGYLALQSGLAVSEMDLKKVSEIANVNIAPDGSVLESAPEDKAKIFQLTGSVLGTYEGMKVFFDRLAHISRFQTIQSFSIEAQKEEGAPSPQIEGNVTNLKGTFVVDYGYLPKKTVLSALSVPVFFQSELNFSDVALLEEKITSIPTLEKNQTGKPNPFQ